MSCVVFIGPTLRRDELTAFGLDAELRGPARAGDVLRAVNDGARTIALVDGYFEHVLPVWHKEILWALSRGVAVLGASSMGALRAAELHGYGMRGVGRIFEAYRDGLLEDDDEVALAHAGADEEYSSQSEALVNIRVTLHAAMAAEVMTRLEAERFLGLARNRFYPERSFHQLLDDAARDESLARRTPALRDFLGPKFERRIDQKAADARELFGLLASGTHDKPPAEPFAFAYTEAFHELQRRVSAR